MATPGPAVDLGTECLWILAVAPEDPPGLGTQGPLILCRQTAEDLKGGLGQEDGEGPAPRVLRRRLATLEVLCCV
jgi:hypothetical protein